MPGLRIKVNSAILPILTLKFVVMATSLEQCQKRVKSVIYNGEDLVKIGLGMLSNYLCLKIIKNKERN